MTKDDIQSLLYQLEEHGESDADPTSEALEILQAVFDLADLFDHLVESSDSTMGAYWEGRYTALEQSRNLLREALGAPVLER